MIFPTRLLSLDGVTSVLPHSILAVGGTTTPSLKSSSTSRRKKRSANTVANHDGARFLWNFRPDLYNFEHLPPSVYDFFSKEDTLIPAELAGQSRAYYDRFWRPLQFGISLGVYESHMNKKPSLDEQVKAASTKAPNAAPEPAQNGPER